jgi:DNA-binding HxlR family transcriptional regulator
MSKLHPTLWRTCRVIACETRLRLLWSLFENERQSVADLAKLVGISPNNASLQLRTLNARGLIVPRRENLRIYYRPEANQEVVHAEEILEALRRCAQTGVSFKTVIRQATALTHLRRIIIVRALDGRKLSTNELKDVTGISTAALTKHLLKLEARGFVKNVYGTYRLHHPGNILGRTLLKAARS